MKASTFLGKSIAWAAVAVFAAGGTWFMWWGITALALLGLDILGIHDAPDDQGRLVIGTLVWLAWVFVSILWMVWVWFCEIRPEQNALRERERLESLGIIPRGDDRLS